MFKKILLAYDGSEGAKRALEAGINLAKLHQAELCALAVQEVLPRTHIDTEIAEAAFSQQHFEQVLEEARTRAQEAGIALKTEIRSGHPPTTIVDMAREGGVDLIVVGHSRISGLLATFLGSTAEIVSRYAPCCVLIVR